jgi:Kae1-associated kinase Bud32
MNRKISEGAEAVITSFDFGGVVSVAKIRERKGYRNKEMDEKIRMSRTRREAKIMRQASIKGISSPELFFYGGNMLVMERLDGTRLSEILKVKDNEYAAKILPEVGALLGKLHSAAITHGDFTPANILVDDSGKPWVIDFGLSDITESDEERGLDLLLMKRYVGNPIFRHFLKGYKKAFSGSGSVEKRLSEIEKRGRYQTRTLLAD